jgi:hypothetical protein
MRWAPDETKSAAAPYIRQDINRRKDDAMARIGKHAIVIGASMGGLRTA